MTEEQRLKIVSIVKPLGNISLKIFAFYAYSLAGLSSSKMAISNPDDYYEAWDSDLADPLLKYLDPILQAQNISRESLNEMADLLYKSFISPVEYIESICPLLFSGFPQKVISFLLPKGMSDSREIFYACIKVIAVVYLHNWMVKLPYPTLAEMPEINSESIAGKIFEVYESFKEDNEQYRKLLFNNDELFQLWLLLYGYDYDPKPVKRSIKINRIVEKLNTKGVSTEQQLQIFFLSKVYNSLDTKNHTIDYPYRYLRMIYTPEKVIATSNNNQTSPAVQFYALEEDFNDSVQTLRKTDPLEFIRSLYFGLYHKEMAMENGYIYQRFFLSNNVKKGFNKLIIQPNPDFVEKCMTDPRIDSNKLVFVFDSEYLAALYVIKFPNGHFAFYESVDNSWSIHKIEKVNSKDFRYIRNPLGKDYQTALFFARDTNKNKLQSLFGLL